MKKIVFEKVKIDDFIENHSFINYCEAIIFPDGDISYACPSHQNAILNFLNMSVEEAMDIIPMCASPIHWLVDKSGCIAVWTNGYIKPTGEELYYRDEIEKGLFLTRDEKAARYNYTCSPKQKESLNKLLKKGLVLKNSLR